MYERFTNGGKVICQLCGKDFGVITPTHLKTHGINIIQYREKFPDFPIKGLPWSARRNKSNNIDLFKEIIKENEEIENIRSVVKKEVKPEIKDEKPKEEIKIKRSKKRTNKIGKDNVYYKLKESYPNIQLNYTIRKKRNDGILLYQFITDMADPIQKIDFEFPDTFWHNSDSVQNINRDALL